MTVAAILLLLATSASAVSPGTGMLVRVGQELRYYTDCTIATNILSPGDAGDSHLVALDCVAGEVIQTGAPSWVMDQTASYGGTWVNGESLGECWLIRQQLIANADKSLTIECAAADPEIYASGFES